MNAFSVWVGLGVMAGLWRVAQSAPQRQAGIWVNAGLFVLGLTLVGARFFYVLISWDYFASHLIEMPQVWLGGLVWPGALAGAGLALIFLGFQYRASRRRLLNTTLLPLGWLGDHLYPLLPPLAITTWLGCWQAGIAYGAAMPAGTFGGIPSLDENGVYTLRFPLQLLAALTLLAYFFLLETRLKPPRPAGRLSGLAAVGLLLHLLAASLLRADPAPTWYGLRVDTWMAVIFLGILFTVILINNLVPRITRKSSFHHSEQIPS